MSSKFSDSTLAEAAYAIAGHGFADTFGEASDLTGWNGLATVSPVLLMNVGETDLAETLRARYGDAEYIVWIREDNSGFVDVVEWGTSSAVAEHFEAFEESLATDAD